MSVSKKNSIVLALTPPVVIVATLVGAWFLEFLPASMTVATFTELTALIGAVTLVMSVLMALMHRKNLLLMEANKKLRGQNVFNNTRNKGAREKQRAVIARGEAQRELRELREYKRRNKVLAKVLADEKARLMQQLETAEDDGYQAGCAASREALGDANRQIDKLKAEVQALKDDIQLRDTRIAGMRQQIEGSNRLRQGSEPQVGVASTRPVGDGSLSPLSSGSLAHNPAVASSSSKGAGGAGASVSSTLIEGP